MEECDSRQVNSSMKYFAQSLEQHLEQWAQWTRDHACTRVPVYITISAYYKLLYVSQIIIFLIND